jgi:4-amino-4-deoxy-L-arabinose transferase-like glycosyltransferase
LKTILFFINDNDTPSPTTAVCLTILALLVRLVHLGKHSFWFDESLEVNRALTPWPDVIFLNAGPDPPVFRLLIAPLTAFSRSEFVLRLPSVILGAAAVYLLYYWLANQRQAQLGAIAALLLAVSPIAVFYAQEVGQYSLVIFLSTALLVAFNQVEHHGRYRDWAILTFVSAVAFYSYYGLAWLWAVLMLRLTWLTWWQRSRQQIVGFSAYSLTLLASLTLLYRLFLAVQFSFMQDVSLQSNFDTAANSEIIANFFQQLPERFAQFQTVGFAPTTPWPITAFFSLLLLGGIIILSRRPETRHFVWLPAVTLVVFYIAAGLGYYHFGWRYGLPLLPFVTLFIAAVPWRLNQQWPKSGGAMLAVIISLYVFFLPNLFESANPWQALPREEMRPVVAYLNKNVQENDVVYVYYGAAPAYRVYQPEPEHLTVYGRWFRAWSTEEKATDIVRSVNHANRFWLVMSHIHLNEDAELIAGLSAYYEIGDAYYAPNAAIILWLLK